MSTPMQLASMRERNLIKTAARIVGAPKQLESKPTNDISILLPGVLKLEEIKDMDETSNNSSIQKTIVENKKPEVKPVN